MAVAYYLLTGRYTAEGLRGMVEKAEDRTEASGVLMTAFGGYNAAGGQWIEQTYEPHRTGDPIPKSGA